VLDAAEIGRVAEAKAQQALERFGWRLKAKNHKVSGVELDLLVSHPAKGVLVCEVKSLRSQEYSLQRVSSAQKRRLSRACRALEARWGCEVCLIFAFVDSASLVVSFYDFSGEIWDPDLGPAKQE
jgi:Holliday junction resolvase-like predicted endonuclease